MAAVVRDHDTGDGCELLLYYEESYTKHTKMAAAAVVVEVSAKI